MTLIYTLVVLVLLNSVNSEKVYTKYGIYDGFTEDIDGKQVNKFYGIPYAKPPVGDLRFRPPRSPTESSNVTIQAKLMKPACPQNTVIFKKVYASLLHANHTNEDCLYLNVYVPGTVNRYRTDPLPVMVWIHGGAFQFGSGFIHDGSRLALSGNVIVVTMNYRLGILGFLATEDMVARGNFGLLDQVKALQWVQRNIDSFGGDPGKVTIFGEASGAYSVGLHMLSPQSEGLFIRAISQSGTSVMNGLNKHPLERTLKVAEQFNCTKVENTTVSVVQMVRCLRAVPVDKLIQADGSLVHKLSPFTPTIDGLFLVRDPVDIVKSGKYTAVDYVVGLNSDEGSAKLETLPSRFRNEGFNRTTFETLLSHTYLSVYPKTLPPKQTDVIWSALLSHYLPADDNMTAFRRRYLDASRDVFGAQTLQYVKYHSAKANCYVYYFSHRPSDSASPSYIETGHADDIKFVFGDITRRGTRKEIELSVDWMKAWTSFAKTGNPSFKGDVNWPKYNTSSEYYLEITDNITTSSVKTRLLESGSLLWNDVLPGIMSLDSEPDLTAIGRGMAALRQNAAGDKDWGMSRQQAEEVMLSLILVVMFLATVCAALIRMVCYTDRKRTPIKDGHVAGHVYSNKAYHIEDEDAKQHESLEAIRKREKLHI